MSEKNSNEDVIVQYDEFAKLNFRIATIETVEPIPKSDKLLKLQIKIGSETRTLVAGIKETYTPEDLVGKQIVVFTNLKPRKVFGVKSQGMLLAADVDGKAVLLQPDKAVPSGSKVR